MSAMNLFGFFLVLLAIYVALLKPAWLPMLSIFAGGISLRWINGGERIAFPILGDANLDGLRLLALSVGILLVGASQGVFVTAFDFWPYAVFVGWAASTLVRTPIPGKGLAMLFRLSYPYLLFLTVFTLAVRRPWLLKQFDRAIEYGAVAVLIGSALITVLQGGFQVEGQDELRRFQGIDAGASSFGGYSALMSLYFASRYLAVRRWKYFTLGLIFGGIVVLTVSRISITGWLLGFAVLCLLSNEWKTLVGGLLIAVTMLASSQAFWERMFVSSPQSMSEALDAVAEQGLTASVHERGRLTIWQNSWEHFGGEVIYGAGLEATGWYSVQVLGAEIIHNEYLRLLLEVGVFGFAWWIATYTMLFSRAFAAWRSRGPASTQRPALAIAALVFYAVYCTVDNGVDYYGPIGQYVWTFAALCLAEGRLRRGAASAAERQPAVWTAVGPTRKWA